MAYFAPNMHEPMANEPRRHRREVEEPVQVIVQPDPDRDRLGNTDWCTCGSCLPMVTHP